MPADYALLCTDIVDSTAVNSRLGDRAMAEVWALHDRRSRDLLVHWRGREVDRADGFMVLFDEAADAAGFVADYHRALAELPVPLRARAGLHVGALEWRANTAADVARGTKPAELVGIAKAVSARLMALAQGGQTLASPSALAALTSSGWRRLSHGHWRLKGWTEPIEVFEIGDEHALFVPPPDSEKAQRVVRINGQWISAREVPNNLPAERDGFVGRAGELQALARRFESGERLVTLHGPGGVGKTRFSLRYGWAWRGDYPGGLWFCDLAQARSLDGVLQAVAHGLDVPLGSDPVGQLGRAIAGRQRCLLILDNFEQVTRLAAESVGHWLDAAPQARIIVTSREVLGLAGENTLDLPPLTAEDAMALFHQRAAAAGATHDASLADEGAVRALVDLLDRLPLAIELAAPRMRVMPALELLARMGDRFRLLATRDGRPDRQATLRATLEWSWDLLAAAERSALAQLSVFEGGCSWAAIEAVVDVSACEHAPWLVDLVQSLVDKSLLRHLPEGRFGLLRSVQEFAAGKLAGRAQFPASGATLATATQERHRHFFAGLDERAATTMRCVELDNLVLACRNAVANGNAAQAGACLMLSWAALRLTGPFAAAVTLADQVRAIAGLQGEPAAIALTVAGMALQSTGDNRRAHAALLGACDALPADARPMVVARVHCALGNVEAALGEYVKAAKLLSSAYEFALASGHPATLCLVLNSRGMLSGALGKISDARADYEAALAVATAHADLRWQGGLLGNLGYLHYAEGRLDDARRAYERTLAVAREGGDRHWEGNSLCNLGLIHHDQGDHKSARIELTRALEMARAIGYRQLEYTVQCNLGIVCESLGEFDAAHCHLEAAVAGAQASSDVRAEGQFRSYLGPALARLGSFDLARSCLQRGLELLEPLNDALNSGLLLCSRAEVEYRAGSAVAAQAALDAAAGILRDRLGGVQPELQRRVDQLLAMMAAGAAPVDEGRRFNPG